MATRRDKQEVLNYLNVLENMGKLIKGNPIDDFVDLIREESQHIGYQL